MYISIYTHQRSNCQHLLDHWNSKRVPKKHLFLLYWVHQSLCVDHNKLWKILKQKGIPDHLTCLLRNVYAGEEVTVRTGLGTTDWFQIRKGVHQDCILSPCLFWLLCRVYHAKCQAGWSTSWSQDCQELWAETFISSCPTRSELLVLGLLDPDCEISTPVLRAMDSDLTTPPVFLIFPACRRQIRELLSIRNYLMGPLMWCWIAVPRGNISALFPTVRIQRGGNNVSKITWLIETESRCEFGVSVIMIE